MSTKDRMAPLDKLFFVVLGFSSVGVTIGLKFGVDPLAHTLMVLTLFAMYVGWVLYIGGYKATWIYSEDPEASLIERVRGWSYLIGLSIAILGNTLAFFGLAYPHNLIVGLITATLVASTVFFLPKKIFQKQIILFDELQRERFENVLFGVARATIYLSVIILFVGFPLSSLVSNPTNLYQYSLLVVIIQIYSLRNAYRFEKYSQNNASTLSLSLKKVHSKTCEDKVNDPQ